MKERCSVGAELSISLMNCKGEGGGKGRETKLNWISVTCYQGL